MMRSAFPFWDEVYGQDSLNDTMCSKMLAYSKIIKFLAIVRFSGGGRKKFKVWRSR
jgi:hypothetical protein